MTGMSKDELMDVLDSYAIVAPDILKQENYRRSLSRILMVIHMMRADNIVKPEETRFLKELLELKLALDGKDAQKLAKELSNENSKTLCLEQLADYVVTSSTEVERINCIREMWEVAVCDSELHTLENKFAYECAEMLQVDANELDWLRDIAIVSQEKEVIQAG